MRTQNTTTGAGNTTAARTFTRNYYEVQHRGLCCRKPHGDSCDVWLLSAHCKTLDEARQYMANKRADCRIIRVDAVYTIID